MKAKQFVFSACVSILLLLGIIHSAQFGFSKLLTRYALIANNLPAVTEAIRIAPSDADSYRARASILNRLRLFDQSKNDLEIATALRPADDYLWLELGLARDEIGDSQGALTALDRAVKLAPYYAHTHWQRGNLLLRLGRYDEAFADLRHAAKANRTFLPSLVDLAWSLSRQDATVTTQLLQIESSYERVLFTRFLARKGRGPETLTQFRIAPEDFSDVIKKELVRQLMDQHAYIEANEIWRNLSGAPSESFATVHDGGFESALAFDDIGFGWLIPRAQPNTSLSLDFRERHSGNQSLRIAFSGDTDLKTAVISQTLLVQAENRYVVSFAVKTRELVSGGPPFITVKDAAQGVVLARSETFQVGTSDWRTVSLEFAVPKGSQAVVLNLERGGCEFSQCPIFGVVWLDSFSISKAAVLASGI